jgi:catechol 2,3-dioxygenase-like lactoylglutathione lyase family enzyme
VNVTNLDSVTFGITDFAACRRFWTDFGLVESTGDDGAIVFSCKNGSTVAARRQRSEAAGTDQARRDAARSRLRVRSPADHRCV